MTVSLTSLANNQSFGTLLQRVDDVVAVFASNAVTTDSTSGGGVTTGNGFVNGNFGSVILFAGNSVSNIFSNSTSLNASWGLSGNSSGFYVNNAVYSNSFTTPQSVVNTSGVFAVNSLNSNTLYIANNLVVNGVTTYAQALHVNSNVNTATLNALSSIFVGATFSITPTTLAVGNTSLNTSTHVSDKVIVGSGSIIANSLGLYANVINANNITFGNSSVNNFSNSTALWLSNSSYTFFGANTSGIYTNGNMIVSGSLFISGNTTTTGTTIGTGDYIPTMNSYSLGNTTNRWTIWGMSANLLANCTVGNTIIVGTATLNSTVYTGQANNALYIGGLIASNVVSNAQLSSNLANYPNTVQLAANMASALSTAGLPPYLATYTGNLSVNVVSGSLISVGNSSANVVANATSLKVSNSTASITFVAPTAAQVSNGQYFLDSGGAWVLNPTTSGSVITTGTSTQNIDSFSIAANYAAEYLIVVGDNSAGANSRYITSILLTHDGNNAYITEWGSITTNSYLGAFESTTNSTFCTLNFTPTSTNTTIRYTRTLI